VRSLSEPLARRAAPGLSLSPFFLLPPLPIESATVQPTPAVDTLAPSPSTTAAPANTLERHVGELVAAAATAILQALREFQNGGLTASTKMQGGDLICELYRLRQFMIADWPFDAIAREHGKTALREMYGTRIDERTIDLLIGEVLDILQKVVRLQMN